MPAIDAGKRKMVEENPEEKDWRYYHNAYKRYYWILLLMVAICVFCFMQWNIYQMTGLEDIARFQILGSMENSIRQKVQSDYPNLPQYQIDEIVKKEFEVALDQNKDQITQQTIQTATFFKSKFSDDTGHPYLHAIDPYLYFHQAENYISSGHFGDEFKNGESFDTLRYGRDEKKSYIDFVAVAMIMLYKLGPFERLMHAAFFLPTFLMFFTVIFAFLLGKKIAGNIGGFLASFFIAVSPHLIVRASAGFADTDPFIALFSIMAVYFFVSSLMAKKIKHKIYWMIGTILSTVLFILCWSGWWYIFNILIAGSILLFVYNIFIIKKSIKIGLLMLAFYSIGSVVLGSLILSTLYTYGFFHYLLDLSTAPFLYALWFIRFKEVGIATIWPNVLTTVAELGTTSMSIGLETIGGLKIVVVLVIGMFFLFKKNKIFVCCAIPWLLATFYAASTSIRFSSFMAISLCTVLGISISMIIDFVMEKTPSAIKINKYWALIPCVGFCFLFMMFNFQAGFETAKQRTPSFNDAWYETLKGIEADSEDAIITSWWDYGHWFYAISHRRVTFDGGDQERRIHFVGKILSTDSETEAINILRMLNCGQEGAYDYLLNEGYDEYSAYKHLMEDIADPQSPLDDGYAKLTHCTDIIPQYLIVSQDMVGKSGVWSHFGNWDFDKARMYNDVIANGISFDVFEQKYNQSHEIYFEIQNTPADQWISQWYGYFNGFYCSRDNATFNCDGFVYDTNNRTNINSDIYSIIYNEGNDMKEDIINEDGRVSVILSDGLSMFVHPSLAKSMFTRLFFLDGIGLKHFKKFSDMNSIRGERIIVYKVDLGG